MTFATSLHQDSTGMALVAAGLCVFFLGMTLFAAFIDRITSPVRVGVRPDRRRDIRMAAAWLALIAAVYVGPGVIVRVTTGTFPLALIDVPPIRYDMTPDDITAALGAPHGREVHDGGETWRYLIDSFGSEVYAIRFDDRGRIDHISIDRKLPT